MYNEVTMSIVRYLIIFSMAGLVLAGASILWPKFTTKPRPQVLTSVHEAVKGTEVGQRFDRILEPVNVSSFPASIAGAMTSAVTQKTQQIITTQFIDQLSHQYDKLPESEKQQLHQLICKP